MAAAAAWLALPGIGHGDDLWEVYQTALARDAAYGAARHEYQSARLDAPAARAALLPTVSLQGSVGQTQDNNNQQNNFDSYDHSNIGLTARMPLFDFGVWSEVSQGRLRAARAAIRFDQAQDDLILRVAERYFEVLAARDRKEVARRQKLSIQRQRDFAAERLAVGVGTQADLFDAEARFQQAVADLIEADNAIDNAAQALKRVVGDAPASLTAYPADAPLPPPSPASVGAWVERAAANHLALKAAEYDLAIAREEIKRQRAARLPRIGLEADRGRRRVSDHDDDLNGATNSTSVSATLSWTLFAGGALHHRTRQASLRAVAAEQTREDIRRRIEADATESFLAVTGGLSRAQALSEAVRAGTSALAAKEEGFRAGLTTNLDVLDAQRDLARSRTDHLRARYDFLLSVLRLERAAGDLDESDLQRVNDWLTAG
ncbi:MAG: TolC family outer membrane protein [bacterium]